MSTWRIICKHGLACQLLQVDSAAKCPLPPEQIAAVKDESIVSSDLPELDEECRDRTEGACAVPAGAGDPGGAGPARIRAPCRPRPAGTLGGDDAGPVRLQPRYANCCGTLWNTDTLGCAARGTPRCPPPPTGTGADTANSNRIALAGFGLAAIHAIRCHGVGRPQTNQVVPIATMRVRIDKLGCLVPFIGTLGTVAIPIEPHPCIRHTCPRCTPAKLRLSAFAGPKVSTWTRLATCAICCHWVQNLLTGVSEVSGTSTSSWRARGVWQEPVDLHTGGVVSGRAPRSTWVPVVLATMHGIRICLRNPSGCGKGWTARVGMAHTDGIRWST